MFALNVKLIRCNLLLDFDLDFDIEESMELMLTTHEIC